MLEGSSYHQILNLKEIDESAHLKYKIENFSPVIERLEEYDNQSNEEQKGFSRQSGIKEEDINKAQLKDSVISQILINLDGLEKRKSKTLIIKQKSLFNQPKSMVPKPKKCLKTKETINNHINNMDKKKISFNIPNLKSDFSVSNNINVLYNKKENIKENITIMRKPKRKTISILRLPKRASQLLKKCSNASDLFQQDKNPKNARRTCKEKTIKANNNSYIQSIENIETNQKLNKTRIRHSPNTLDNSRISDDFRISSIIKQNKIQLVKGNNSKNLKLITRKEFQYIQSLLNDPIIIKNENLLKKLKFFSFIQSVSSLISILLCIIDIELYNRYSFDYIIKNKIEYQKLYEIAKRQINSKENTIRWLNCIFSFICLLMTFCIFFIKYYFNKKEEKKARYLRNKDFNYFRDLLKRNKKQKISHKGQLSKVIIRSIINFIFYPPKLNFIFYTYSNNILCIYPFNSFILLISSFKLYNIYRCIFYFLPLTATIGKAICQKHNVKMNIKFMFRTFLSRHKIFFPLCVVIILIIIISILLKSVEFFSVDLSVSQNTKIPYNLIEFYDTMWMYLSFLMRNPSDNKPPKTPFGKILLLIIYIIGSLFLCMIYYRLNYLIQLDRTSLEAYTKLEKLFKPENKENKASELILSFILLKKNYSLYYIEEIKKKSSDNNNNNSNNSNNNNNNKSFINRKRRTIFNLEISKLKEQNFFIIKQKRAFFLRIKFSFLLKFFSDINNYNDSLRLSRKHPLNLSSVFQKIEGKMDENLETISLGLSSINYIEAIFNRLKANDSILLKKLKQIKKHSYSIIKYLLERNNFQCHNFNQKKELLKTDIKKSHPSLNKCKSKLVSFKSLKVVLDKV